MKLDELLKTFAENDIRIRSNLGSHYVLGRRISFLVDETGHVYLLCREFTDEFDAQARIYVFGSVVSLGRKDDEETDNSVSEVVEGDEDIASEEISVALTTEVDRIKQLVSSVLQNCASVFCWGEDEGPSSTFSGGSQHLELYQEHLERLEDWNAKQTAQRREAMFDLKNELHELLPGRPIEVHGYDEGSDGLFKVTLICKPGDPSNIAEDYVGNGHLNDEPGMDGPDEDEHRMIVEQSGGTYFAHWLPDAGQVDVYVPNNEGIRKECLDKMKAYLLL